MENYNLSLKRFYCFLLYVGFIGSVYIFLNNISSLMSEWIQQINFVLFIIICVNFFLFKSLFGYYITLTNIFVILLELFNFCPMFINLVGFTYSEVGLSAMDVMRIYGFSTCQEVVEVAIFFILFFCAGAILSESIQYKKTIITSGNVVNIKSFAKFLLVLSLPFDIMLSVYKTINVVSEGYGNNLDQSPIYLVQYISFLVLAGAFLLWSVEDNHKKKNNILIAFIVYKIFGMMTGQRAEAVCAILIALCLYIYGVKVKVTFKKVIYVLLASLLIIFLLVFIRSFRLTGYQTIDYDILLSFSLLNFFAEWNTLNIIAEVISFSGSHTMGISTLYSIACVIPGIKSFDVDLYDVDIYYVLNLYRYGSSIIAEILFDWNCFGVVIFFVIGFFVRRLDSMIFRLIQNKKYIAVIYWIPFFMQFLYSVRSTTLGWLRSILFAFIIINVCLKLFHFIYRGRLIK